MLIDKHPLSAVARRAVIAGRAREFRYGEHLARLLIADKTADPA